MSAEEANQQEKSTKNIRVKGEDRELISDLKTSDLVQQKAVEEGVIEEEKKLNYEELLLTIIPEDAEPMARPEEDMAWLNAGDAKERILNLAGENVSVHEVVTAHLDSFVGGNPEALEDA